MLPAGRFTDVAGGVFEGLDEAAGTARAASVARDPTQSMGRSVAHRHNGILQRAGKGGNRRAGIRTEFPQSDRDLVTDAPAPIPQSFAQWFGGLLGIRSEFSGV